MTAIIRPASAVRWAWPLLIGHPVGQLSAMARPLDVSVSEDASGQGKDAVHSALCSHACTLQQSTDGPLATIRSVYIAVPTESPVADTLFTPDSPINYAVGHTNPTMAKRFKQIQKTLPRLSLTAQTRRLPDDQVARVFSSHFARHPLLRQRTGKEPSKWRICELELLEAMYVDSRGEVNNLSLPAAPCHVEICAVSNLLMAKLNEKPADLVRICNTLYTRRFTAAFVYHMDEQGFRVMGKEDGSWGDYEMDYKDENIKDPKGLEALVQRLLQHASKSSK